MIIAIPSSPGSWGVYEFGVQKSIEELFKISPELSAALAIALHLSTFIPYTLIGGIYFIKYYFYDDVIINNNIKV